ncbi:MAG: YfiR family protein [Flavobacteriales bacterium]
MRQILTLIAAVTLSLAAHGQLEMNNTKTVAVVKGSYIYNFAKNCQWDESFYETEVFKMAVYGDRDLYNELIDKYDNRPINNQVVEVVWVKDLDVLFDEQIIFLSEIRKNDLILASNIAEENGSLLITDFIGAISLGSIINFVIVENTISFDLNLAQAVTNDINLGNRMNNWANKIVEE